MDPLKENSGGKSYALSGKIMLSAIIILFTVVILIVCLHIYARWFLLRSITRRQSNRSRRRRIRRTRIIFAVDPSDSFLVASTRGLDYSVLKSLPTFVYSSSAAATTGHGGELQECAVCLSEFEEGEEGRLLPKCNHSFHTACIDMWFHSHSTCPLCRTLVTPQIPALPSLPSPPTSSEIPVEFAVNVAEPETRPSSDLCPSCEHYENERPSSSSSASLPSPRPSSASSSAVTISIQVPRRNYFRSLEEEQFNLGSPRIQGLKSPLKSPGGRIQSLKRMFSRDWIGSVSPSSATGMSYNSNAEIDLENGDEHQISPQSKR